MVRLHVVDVHLRFQCCDDELVHVDVGAIKLKSADSILHIGVPSEAVGAQVEHFDIAIVVTSCQTSFLLIVGISECDCPAVWLDGLVF